MAFMLRALRAVIHFEVLSFDMRVSGGSLSYAWLFLGVPGNWATTATGTYSDWAFDLNNHA